MINISSEGLKALKNEAFQKIKISVTPLSGIPFEITDSDILLDGFNYETHSVDGEELQIGNMNSAVLDLSLDNASEKFNNVKFAGAVLKPKIGIVLPDDSVEWVRFGEFTVDEQPHLWETIELSAYDNMVRLDYPFDYSIFPVSMRALVQAGITQCGLTCNDYSMFPEILILAPFTSQSVTWRQVIMWCCQCACVNGIADELGNIKFGYYKKVLPEFLVSESGEVITTESGEELIIDGNFAADYDLAAGERFIDGMSLDEEDIIITGHRFLVDGVAYPENVVTDYCIETEGNLIFSALSDEDKSTVSAAVNEAIKGFTYRPFNSNVISLPILQTLDSVKYINSKGQYYSPITNIEYKPNGLMSIASKAKSQRAKGYASLGALTPGQKAIVEQINRETEQTQKSIGIEARTRMAINEAMYNSMGFYSTVEQQADGSEIRYCHDKPNLSDSKVVYKITLEGTAWTSDYNGSSTVWQYGVDIKGNAVFSTIVANTLSANLIKTGLLQSKNGASWINLDDGTFSFGKKVMFGLFTMPVLSLDDEGYLSMFGKLCSAWDKDRKFGFMNNGIGLTYGSTDIFNIDSFKVGNNRKVEFKAPFTRNASNLYGKQLILSDNYASLEAFHTTSINVKSACLKLNASSDGQTFDLYAKTGVDYGIRSDPTWGVIIYVGSHQAYLGNSGTFYVEAFDFISDREKKENICEIRPDALEDLCKLRFYSYNIKDGGPTVKMGVMADEVPDIIAGENKKSVSSYPFSCFIARALQQLADKVDALEKRVEALEKENQILKEENL